MKIAVVTPISNSGERGGAENFYEGLIKALIESGHDATQVEVLVDESSFEGILEAYCRCFYLDVSDYDVVISTKAPTYMVRHPNHISCLLHTIRVFYDMFDREFKSIDEERIKQRRLIHKLDKYGLSSARIKKHFVIGCSVCERMRASDDYWNQIEFQVLHLPPKLQGFKTSSSGDIIFFPGRLHRWKRPDLIIKAMKYVNHNIDLIISGRGEDEEIYRQLSRGDSRIKFVGWINDDEIVDYYSRSIVVPFVPINEDYGLVTVEAFKSKKPVITCTDSGEPCNIVKDGVNGFIVEPDPKKIAEKINYLIENPKESTIMGENGYVSVQNITWEGVISSLLGDMQIISQKGKIPDISVLIADMQPIEPAVGGGRLRLKGLYSSFPSNLKPLYVGTYDWKGCKKRELQISKSLKEIDIPLDDEHFKINEYLNKLSPGVTIIDAIFPLLAIASQEYVNVILYEAKKADVVVLSHPWLYPIIKNSINFKNKILIYDSQNCEAILREDILGATTFAKCISHMVKFVEKELCEESNLILSCSEEDKHLFEKLYSIDPGKIEVYPNGVATDRIKPVDDCVRTDNKKVLNIDKKTAMFIGSSYLPNIEAAEYIINTLSRQCPEIVFLIVGGVGEKLDKKNQKNVKIYGSVSEEDKEKIFAASDIAINPILHGSGTNIKMFDYLAAGIPTISTPVGARGIDNDGSFIVCDLANFPSEIRRLLQDNEQYEKLSISGRELAERDYDWNKISLNLGSRLCDIYSNQMPAFSIIIPMYRGDYIKHLVDRLNSQSFRDFEVIIVDSGEERGDYLYEICNFKLKYIFDKNAGAARARNIGIKYARGEIIAFTDDDCQPDPDWLENARNHFCKYDSVGLEGRIYTDEMKLNDPNYRCVQNLGMEGLGFMTANLFIRHDIIIDIGGFDERFDKPHFREDTDLAWRALDHGQIPFADDVRVYHPALKRTLKGESKEDRDYFFVNDALLCLKHPNRYMELMKAEGHYIKNKNYWKFFIKGCKQIGSMNIVEDMTRYPDIRKYMPKEVMSIISH